MTWSGPFQKAFPFILLESSKHWWHIPETEATVLFHPETFPEEKNKEKKVKPHTDLNQVCNLGAGGNFQQV